MVRSGATLGGEQSGHVVFLDQATTGDGILTAVRFLSLAARDGVPLAELAGKMRRYPQVLENVKVDSPAAVASGPEVAEAVLRAERALGESGRILVRPSGTEPVVRVMVEAELEEDARRHVAEVVAAVRAVSG
jgi:phosphoglucosamine mutase